MTIQVTSRTLSRAAMLLTAYQLQRTKKTKVTMSYKAKMPAATSKVSMMKKRSLKMSLSASAKFQLMEILPQPLIRSCISQVLSRKVL
jgi:hypothetical protein